MYIRALDGFYVDDKYQNITISHLLLVYIAHEELVSRDVLAQYFYGDKSNPRQRLRNQLDKLKNKYGDIFENDNNTIKNKGICTDALELRQHLNNIHQLPIPSLLERVCELYKHNFLHDADNIFHEASYTSLNHWIMQERNTLSAQFWKTILSYAKYNLTAVGDYLTQSMELISTTPFSAKQIHQIHAILLMTGSAQLEHFRNDIFDYVQEEFSDSIGCAQQVLNIKHTIHNLPSRNNVFVGRKEVMQQIANNLRYSTKVAPQTLYGLGGIGKTQLAIEYAYLIKEEYSLVWFINAETEASLSKSFVSLALQKGLVTQEVERQEQVEASLRYLRANRDWLLIFDNAEHPRDIQEYLIDTGHTIVTSRFNDWIELATPIQVNVYSNEEVFDFLEKRLDNNDRKGTLEMAELLGHLPLALAQAASYIVSNNISIQEYQELFRKAREKLWCEEKPTLHYYQDSARGTVATTWNISLQRLKEHKGAKELLDICSFFSAENIPLQLFEQTTNLPQCLQQVLSKQKSWQNLLAVLSQYSLIQVQDNQLSMHRLLQAVARDNSGLKEYIKALELVNEAFEFDPYTMATWDVCDLIIDHAEMLLSHAPARRYDLNTARLYQKIGDYHIFRSELFAKAEICYRTCLEHVVHISGEQNSLYASGLCGLGLAFENQYNYEQAIDYYNKAIATNDSLINTDISSNLKFKSYFAHCLYKARQFEKSEKLYREIISTYGKGKYLDQPVYIEMLADFAILLDERGKIEEAEQLFKETIDKDIKIGRHQHLFHISKLLSFADFYKQQERFDEAELYARKATSLVVKKGLQKNRVYGFAFNNLAAVLHDRQKYKKAEEIYIDIIQQGEKQECYDDVMLAVFFNNLAKLYLDTQRYNQAIPYYEKAIPILKSILGEEHPNTQTSLRNYHTCLQAVKDKNIKEDIQNKK